ncbi:hypothetical protein [Streptomyces sudanensis]|uniref:hypothetical protein n=1 Tax=Streptomyces sudanensis TaxID=436397 RepID=UPI0020CEDB55|nr:hypothetical protein [Streptomyces sudanensis]MCP9958861.1 hypothetical protein [Streptomyces sudanensis]MCP9987931.1 hypothetical protein [Streptomyces sudanensis]MCQ0000662.1 hypothetical protein [Streptomyces sudanensis]
MTFGTLHRNALWRRAAVGGVTAVVLGSGLAGTAGAADTGTRTTAQHRSSTGQVSEGAVRGATDWSFYRAYWTKNACLSEGKLGKAKGWWEDHSCKKRQGNDGKMKWFLYVYNRR